MKNLEKLQLMRSQMVEDILNYFKTNNIEYIEFDSMFSCLIPEENSIDLESIVHPYIVKRMWNTGLFEVIDDYENDLELVIHELSILEVAYILDTLEEEKYTVLDPETDSYDEDEIEPF